MYRSSKKGKTFERIEDSKLADFHLHPEWFPTSKQDHYFQAHDPLEKTDDPSALTILILAKSVVKPSNIHLDLIQFPAQALQDPDFKPLDQSQSRINLDKSGMQELVAILRDQISYLK